ncbi:PLP-dependent aminotransferase family protein [Paraburkholderia domus]|uniref:HTH-type transcriptional regulatory protein GabR n=1 Tax=Paraburkholderia domus TaxID=2793075 RepID=A0A9N8MZB2_9BURK|nr:PLP-dependent aminotransferase family protein [Paraburkholderia domus]MBK5046843.1 PLP-dependent aminotransferase family protein [Burkholderia sp. R-70006]MBK5123422.1 PLP-dependent aminotransferase family protein [Burkholderia sp. R-69980]MBK5162839.1 PLP-dependent aminotransferase family protein [Burkholderia sp. R-70211]MBK5181407.1 PLP-dependent aminotransferase family protein [Burkholderia sp. R-69749]MCI0150703.1 aminotransferase class I/II-fold pyridoxal phosphate-dependent enzyme [P
MTVATPALTIEIDRQHELPIYLQICERFRTAIAAGHLRPGDRVPALRGLATQLNTARGTVELAYTILVDEGYLQMRGAAGTFVSSSLPASVMRSSRARGVQDARAGQSTEGTGTPQRPGESRSGQAAPRQQAIAVAMSGEPRPLQPGLPALDAFPGKLWNRLVSRRARSGDRAMLAYPDPAGYRPLREHIATYLGLSRGVTCLPDQVFVTGGYRATLELVLRSLASPNDSVWFEDPGYLLARGFLDETGVQLVPVPVDGEGIDVERGTLLDGQARFAVVTPSHQSPLGHTLSLARRMALLDSAEKASRWIIEDDYDSEFRYLGRPLPALKSLDRHDRVIYCGTFSKVMFPGLRLAYVVVPERAVERVGRVAHSMNAGSPTLLQAAVADFIGQGHFARHLKRMRALYGKRRVLIVNALDQAFGKRLIVDLPPRGIQFAVQFAEGPDGPVDDVAVAARAREAGLAVLPLSIWYANGRARRTPRGLVMGFANIADADEAGRLARTLRECLDG